MRKISVVIFVALFLVSARCWSAAVPTDVALREVRVIALTGTLMALVANTSVQSVVYDSMGTAGRGTVGAPLERTYSALKLEGSPDDNLTVNKGSWTRKSVNGVTTVDLEDIHYSSQLNGYPRNNSTPFSGAVVSLDNIKYTVAASTNNNGIRGSFTTIYKGTGPLTELRYTENMVTSDLIDVGTMSIDILEPMEATGTVTFNDSVFGGSVKDKRLILSAVIASTVVFEGEMYSCTTYATYMPITRGNTGIGELTDNLATCTSIRY